jgi:hypothetical protein
MSFKGENAHNTSINVNDSISGSIKNSDIYNPNKKKDPFGNMTRGSMNFEMMKGLSLDGPVTDDRLFSSSVSPLD